MELQPDDVVLGEVTALKSYGAFVRLATGDQGMIHISEVSHEFVRDISQHLKVGQQVVVKVIGRNEEGKYNLSLKRVSRQDQEAARFHSEVTQFTKALNEQLVVKEELVKQLAERQTRQVAKSSLIAWLTSARREIQHLERRQQGRMRAYEPDWHQLAERASSSPADAEAPALEEPGEIESGEEQR
ncbi:MAG: S1 RNA-binding domain-containing protein [Candidatus Bipolaricaulota bacterium]|nr:S1 RNA-binding domain-containing protein [Candidatus Bipolaricaulota bacterium]MCS7274469.1 S1 RNA-binding domain-containing protein [Candidatus Bipolaricaulota bacterium]MDW8110898.1 S1 RNA-binding domain-containing protein [Candidatus Bipolaricaulota bacterium]MDW8329335.1 S1 RNA-binding domain-containing protein [Candidatus Bipolaricaulota bacterium]